MRQMMTKTWFFFVPDTRWAASKLHSVFLKVIMLLKSALLERLPMKVCWAFGSKVMFRLEEK